MPPLLVVIMITPLAPRDPYSAVAVASFSTENDSIDSGGMLPNMVEVISTPSNTSNAPVFEPKVEIPRT